MYVNFSDIPGNQNLFLDYLYEFESVEKFYKKNFRDLEQYPDFLKELAEYDRPHKDKVVKLIQAQYQNRKPSKKTEKNIEQLANPKSVAIVTGQQLGILGGPLYTFYKIITAIKLCDYLKQEFETYNFIPVFWLEGDDHDFEEVQSVNVIDEKNDLVSLAYDDGNDEDENRGSVGKIKFNDGINTFFGELEEKLRETEFTEELLNKLKSWYKEGRTFKDAFADLLFEYFDEYGVVMFDPQDPKVKELLTGLFVKEIENYNKHTDTLVETSAELEEIYHAQVKVKPVNLFLSDENGRYSIEPDDVGFRLKGKRKKFSEEELVEYIKNNPGSISPNVLMRPICQDYLLPTGFYIGGPGEISYFAQVIPLYEFFDIPQPFLYPRSSATIVEKNINKYTDKYDLTYGDLFLEQSDLNEKVVSKIAEVDLNEGFASAKHNINLAIDELKEKLFAVDKTISDAAATTKDKMLQSLDTLKSKADKAQEKQHDIALRQIDKARSIFYPNGTLQERELNYIYFANKYGPDMIKWIFGEITINKFEHQIIEI